jgi:hypothetical protein
MNVLHVPTIMQNLVSIGQIVDQGMEVRFMHLGAFIEEEGRIIARGRKDGRMFILDRTDDGPDTALFAKGQKAESDIDLYHKRISHVNYRRLQDLHTRQVVLGLPKFSGRKAQICEACQLGKQHQLPFPDERNQSHNKLDLIHSDVWGPTQNVSLGGSRYFVSFIDDYTRHTWIYLIERKSEVFDCFWDLKRFVENESGWKIKCLCSDA